MSGDRGLRIYLEELLDQYIESCDGAVDDGLFYPSLYRVTVDDEQWLTDRHWMLPERLCVRPDGMTVSEIPGEKNAATTREWVRALSTVELRPCGRQFGATFAGVLSAAGLRAHEIDGQQFAVLTHHDARIGLLMPVREPMSTTLPIPVPEATADMYREIHDARIVNSWQAWTLAAHLTSHRLTAAELAGERLS
jgi:hypothetical protein